MTRNCNDIRNEFIDFFRKKRGHTFVPSSPLLPAEDPTLLFTNAGMNQFKDIFLGLVKRDYVRAVNSQKCIRAGGKHNDLEDVGHDTYHHTFFEMLGNWSFGDYFKSEAIAWAWELLTGVWGLDKSRLFVTVFEGDKAEGLEPDDDAAEAWRTRTDIDHSHILPGNKKDNFWEMGETGPCGPCSEIHIDMTDDGSGRSLVNAGDSRVIEIWNLVFMQYNRAADGKLTPLPATHVDTGMGFERICMVLQHKHSNYATDLFVPIIEKIETLTSHRYGSAAAAGQADRFDVADMDNITDVAFRVIADHARTLTFAIADGVLPSNEGRGYVLRRILRRACRYGRQYLGIEGPFLVELVDTVVGLMGEAFGEVVSRRDYIAETIQEEEVSFGRTLDRGIDLFVEQSVKVNKANGDTISGEVAFDLYATYGFPVDLTQIMAAEAGIKVDMAGYEKAMAEHQEKSRVERIAVAGAFAGRGMPTEFVGHNSLSIEAAKVRGTAKLCRNANGQPDSNESSSISVGDEGIVVLDKTPFYAEQGGQVGDTGVISQKADGVRQPGGRFEVTATKLEQVGHGQVILCHFGRVTEGTIVPHVVSGQNPPSGRVIAEVNAARRLDIMRNHTGTHLLNWALREVLGEHISQAGSVVAPDRLRFDFSHNQAVTHEQLAQVERMVNERILADEPVTIEPEVPLAEATKIPGVRAVFGEKYPDPVRVILIGTEPLCSAEFCGGTHLTRTGRIGALKIVSEESVAKGVRRITAITGLAAIEHMLGADDILRSAAVALRSKPEDVPSRIEAMAKEIKELRKARKAAPAASAAKEFAPDVTLSSPAGPVLIGKLAVPDANAMRAECDRQRQKGAAGLFLGAASDGKVMLVAMVSDELLATGKMTADKWIKAVAGIVGGGGGGRATLAQAGGRNPDKLPDALTAAGKWAAEALG